MAEINYVTAHKNVEAAGNWREVRRWQRGVSDEHAQSGSLPVHHRREPAPREAPLQATAAPLADAASVRRATSVRGGPSASSSSAAALSVLVRSKELLSSRRLMRRVGQCESYSGETMRMGMQTGENFIRGSTIQPQLKPHSSSNQFPAKICRATRSATTSSATSSKRKATS